MTIITALNDLYGRLSAEGKAPPFGYSDAGIDYCIILHENGKISEIYDLSNTENGKRKSSDLRVPEKFKRSGISPLPYFLSDNSKFVFGIEQSDDKNGIKINKRNANNFRNRHINFLNKESDIGIKAFLSFLELNTDNLLPEEMLLTLIGKNFVFALESDFNESRTFLHMRPKIIQIWQEIAEHWKTDREASLLQSKCLATGVICTPARIHPPIKGIMPLPPGSGYSIVAFEADSFKSYSKERGANAPISEAAAFGYVTALNTLMKRESGNKLIIGDTSVAFWADASGIAAAREAETLAAAALAPRFADEDDDIPTDAQEARKVHDALEKLAQGMPVERASVTVDPATRFYILGLAPNAARLSVRFWQEMTLGRFATALRWHWRDLRLDPPAWKGEPKLQALLYQTAVQDKAENIQPLLGGELMRAVLNPNCRYPRALLSAVLQRIRADGEIRPARAAIVKAWLARDARIAAPEKYETPEKEDPYVSLDREETNAAYRLGRLFAVLESIQEKALGSLNAGIRDKYFGAASATPSAVFPLLLRGSNHHLSVLRKKPESKRLAGWFEGQVGEIMDGLATTLPRHFGLEDQGRFVVGYYHQRNERSAKAGEETGTQGQED